MATVLQPIVNELNTVLVQLRTELRGLQTDAWRWYRNTNNALWKEAVLWDTQGFLLGMAGWDRTGGEGRGMRDASVRQDCLPLSFWGYCYCFCGPGFWISCVLVFFLAVGVALDLGPWDCAWIGFGGSQVAIGLALGVGTLDWVWIGFGLVSDWLCFFVSSPHNSWIWSFIHLFYAFICSFIHLLCSFGHLNKIQDLMIRRVWGDEACD